MYIGLLLAAFLVFYAYYIAHRASSLYQEAKRVLDIVNAKAQQDKLQKKEWLWRYQEYGEIEPTSILFKFWIPVTNLYKDCEACK